MPCHVSALIQKYVILSIDLDCVCEEYVVPSVTPSMIIMYIWDINIHWS